MFATPVARAEVCATLTKHQRGASSGPFRGSVVDRPARGLWGRRPDPREARRSDGVAQWCRQFVRSVCVAQFPRLLYHQTTCAEENVVHLAGPRQSASRAAGPDRHVTGSTGWRGRARRVGGFARRFATSGRSRRVRVGHVAVYRSSKPRLPDETPCSLRVRAPWRPRHRAAGEPRDGPHPHVISEAES